MNTNYKHMLYLYKWILPAIQTNGFHFADSRQVAMHPWAVQAHKDTESVGGPVRFCENITTSTL